MTSKEIIKNAIQAAERDGYNQVVYMNEDGDYSFSRDYPDNDMYKQENVIGKVLAEWINGILTIKYVERKTIVL